MPRRRIGPPSNASEPTHEDFERYAGLGAEEIQPSDLVWMGDNLDRNPDELLEPLKGEDALQEIVRRVVLGNETSEGQDRQKSRSEAETRIENAMTELLGRRAKKGRPPQDRSSVLIGVAERYFKAYFDPEDETQLDTIIREETIKRKPDLQSEPDALANAIKVTRNDFKKQKDRLVSLVTSEGQEVLQERGRDLAEIIRLMRKLGIRTG